MSYLKMVVSTLLESTKSYLTVNFKDCVILMQTWNFMMLLPCYKKKKHVTLTTYLILVYFSLLSFIQSCLFVKIMTRIHITINMALLLLETSCI